jgi:hypothetical protein
MKLSERFSVEPQRDATHATSVNDTTPARVRVLLDGQASRCVVGGEELEAAIECADKFLLVLNDGVFWEEGLNIHLLGPDLQLLDSVSMGWPYTPGIFTKLSLHAPDTIEFSFPGGNALACACAVWTTMAGAQAGMVFRRVPADWLVAMAGTDGAQPLKHMTAC